MSLIPGGSGAEDEECRRCGHARKAHEHHRSAGRECSLCTSCGSFRRPRLLARLAARLRARSTPPPDECAWCHPLGRYNEISILPSDCECNEACGTPWCQARVTA